ncbi:MAG: DUF4124 domain-containing protein [Pseudomonadota bacterium]
MHCIRRIVPLLPALALIVTAWTRPAAAQDTQLNRCIGPGGNTIYTDRPCDSLGAVSRLPRGAAPGNTAGRTPRRGGCARTLQELVYEITNAIDAHDVNRLGAVYHWVGHSPESGYRVLDQLQAVVDRPLIDIAPLRAASATRAADVVDTTTENGATPGVAAPTPIETPVDPSTRAASETDTLAVRPPSRRAPSGLRLEQTMKNGSTPVRTVFGLRRHLDCWWIVF